MTKMFKKLAFMLALGMTISTVAPAATVSAAATPVLNTTGKKIYKETDVATGLYSPNFTLKVWNKGDYRVTFESSNEKVATVSKWWGTVSAVAPGEATITATVINLTTGKTVKTLSSKVWVKRNAAEIGISTASAAKLDNALEIGNKVKLNIYRKDIDGNVAWQQADKTVVTDYIIWESSDTSVATVDKWGTVTAVAPGSATITAKSVQTEDKTLAPTANVVSVDVVVAQTGLTSAAQKDLNTANLTFGTAVTSETVTKDTVKVYELVGSTKVAQTVKAVTIDKVDATKATLDLFVDFTKNATYVVEFDGKEFEFKAVDAVAENVASVKILTNEAVAGTATEVKYALYTENGVDITDAITGRVDLSSTSNDAYVDNNTKMISFFESGKTATVKAVFHTYKYNETGVETTIDTVATITSVDTASVTVGGVSNWTITSADSFNFETGTINQKLSLSDEAYNLFVQVAKSDDSKITNITDAKFSFETSDASVLLVAGSKLYPVKTGNAVVIVKYDDKVIGTVGITVLSERAASTLNVSANKTVLSMGKDFDVTSVTVDVKDQFGVKYAAKVPTIQLLSAPTNGATLYTTATDVVDGKVSMNGSEFTVAGTYQFKVTVGDLTRVFSIIAKEAGTETSYKLELSNKAVDTTLAIATDADANDSLDVALNLYGIDKDGYKTSKVATFVNGKEAAIATGSAFYYEVTDKDGKAVASVDNTFSPITVSGSAISKVKAGTYKVAAYELVDVNGTTTVKPLGYDFITVTDSQATAVVTQKEVKATASTVNGALVNGDIVIELDINNDGKLDKINANSVAAEVIGAETSGSTVFVKTVTYNAAVNYGGVEYTYEMTIAVNKNITLQ